MKGFLKQARNSNLESLMLKFKSKPVPFIKKMSGNNLQQH